LYRQHGRKSIDTALIVPGKPWQNGAVESFNGEFRDKCLSLEWFRSRAEAKVVIEAWRRYYNKVRPHSSLGYSKQEPPSQARSGPKKQVRSGERQARDRPFGQACGDPRAY